MILFLSILLFISLGTALFLGVYLFTQKRALRRLSQQITDILDNNDYDHIGDFHKYQEGELAVLESQTGKLVNRLREQAGALSEDKILLQNSLADISHQLKTPMTSLQLIMAMLADEELDQEQRISYVEHGTQLLNRIDWLVSTLLKLSRLDAGTLQFTKERVDFQKLGKEAVRQVEIPMELKNQELSQNIPENCGFQGDFRWTAEALINILKNCVEHTPENRRLYLTMSENAIYSEIIVEDEGPGILPEERRKIFQRFYQGKNTSEGSAGIGLALSADLIRQQNGTIKAENRKEGGARFVIRFYKQIV